MVRSYCCMRVHTLAWYNMGSACLLVRMPGLTFFVSNMGPNTTTFVLPSETFPTPIRATFHGISAACGKV